MKSSEDNQDVKLPEANDRNVSVPFHGTSEFSFIELHHDANNIVDRQNERRSAGNYIRGTLAYEGSVNTVYQFSDIFRDQPLQHLDGNTSPIARALYDDSAWKSKRKKRIRNHAAKISVVEDETHRFAEDVTNAYQQDRVQPDLRPAQIAATGTLACLAKMQADAYRQDRAYLEKTDDPITKVGAETLVQRLDCVAETLNNCYKNMTMFAPETDSHLPTMNAKKPTSPNDFYTQDMTPDERRFEAIQGLMRDPLKEYNQFFR